MAFATIVKDFNKLLPYRTKKKVLSSDHLELPTNVVTQSCQSAQTRVL